MSIAKKNDRVRVHYVGVLPDNNVFDSSIDSDPIEFVIGDGQMLSGFENAVIGMRIGEKKSVLIKKEDAYGDYDPVLVQVVSKTDLPVKFNPEPGMLLQISDDDGSNAKQVTVTKVNENAITLDGNHSLAGKDLTFDIELIEIL